MSLAYALEKEVAVSAVIRACQLTSSIFNKLVKDERLTKGDKSPVTGTYYVLDLQHLKLTHILLILFMVDFPNIVSIYVLMIYKYTWYIQLVTSLPKRS